MFAALAVFRTYELLECILQHLSTADLARVGRVSRNWHDLIYRSESLHNCHILAPTDKQRHRSKPATPCHNLGQIPAYTPPFNCQLRFNRSIFWPSGHARQHHNRRDYMGHYINFGPEIVEHDWRVKDVWDDFATLPPCQAIALRILREEMYCVVYVRDGVRVRDLRESVNGMLESVGKYVGEESRMRAVVTGWVFEEEEAEKEGLKCVEEPAYGGGVLAQFV